MPEDVVVRLRIRLEQPTPGALGGVQVGSGSTAQVPDWFEMAGSEHDFYVEVVAKSGKLPLTGKTVQKDGKGRFVYIVWRGGPISRRAKVYIENITQDMVDQSRELTVVLAGAAPDGLPCCATVKPIHDWC